jgi:hypothetical protein
MTLSVSKFDRHTNKMSLMTERCGVDIDRLARESGGAVMRDAVFACLFCRHERECNDWLDLGSEGELYTPPSFCPNAERFRRATR